MSTFIFNTKGNRNKSIKRDLYAVSNVTNEARMLDILKHFQ